MDRTATWGVVAALACVLAPTLSVAQPAHRLTSSLNWVRLPGTESCIAARDLATAVEQRLGRTVFVSASQGNLSIEGHVEQSARPPGWRASIVATDASGAPIGRREIHSEISLCSDLSEQIVLVITLMIDPDADLSPRRPSPPPASASSPPPRIERPPPIVIRESSWQRELRIGGSAGVGLLPGIYPGAHVAAALGPPRFLLVELYGSFLPPVTSVDSTGVGGQWWTVLGGFAICPQLQPVPRVRLALCVGAEFGVTGWQSIGLPMAHGDVPVTNVVARIRASVQLAGPLFAFLAIGAAIPLWQPYFPVEDTSTGTPVETNVFAVGYVTGDLQLGLGIHFPS